MVLNYNYSIYQGVNFFWSDGSVADIWYRQIKNGSNISITNPQQIRYYSEVNDICKDILNNINIHNTKITPSNIIEIKLNDLYMAFIKYFDYNMCKIYVSGNRDGEKHIEIIDDNINIEIYNESQIIELIDRTIKYVM
jgi:FlaA1/EpsC-like NDP-sugar epimerase